MLTKIVFILVCISALLGSCDRTGKRLPLVQGKTQTDSLHSVHQSNADWNTGTEDFSPGMFFAALLGFLFMLFWVGFGLALTIVTMMVVFGLVSVGIISTSVLVGIRQRSLVKGFKTFLVLVCSIAFMVLGAGCFWLLNLFTHWWTISTALLYGTGLGLAAGLVVGILAYSILTRMIGSYAGRLLGKL